MVLPAFPADTLAGVDPLDIMTHNKVLEKVRQMAADTFSAPLSSIAAETSPEQVANWDSVQHLNLVMALEGEFGVQFAPEDFDQMGNVGKIAELVAAKLDFE